MAQTGLAGQQTLMTAVNQREMESNIDWGPCPFFNPTVGETKTYGSKAVLSNVERWSEQVFPYLASLRRTEAAKVRSICLLLLGEAAQFAQNFRRDGGGGHNSDYVMNELM